MKLNWGTIVGIGMNLYTIIKSILRVEKTNTSNVYKHGYVKAEIVKVLKKKGWYATGKFTNADVDKIIKGVVWFIKKVYTVGKK